MPKSLYESDLSVYSSLSVEYPEPIYILFLPNLGSFGNCGSAGNRGRRVWVYFHMDSCYCLLAGRYSGENMLEEDHDDDDDFD